MPKYRKKPVVIEAICWTGNNSADVSRFFGDARGVWMRGNVWSIDTLEGVMKAQLGDWIIRGIRGEFYPCKLEIFEQTYEEVEDDAE